MSKWVGHIPSDVVRDMATIAPMLATLGYDPNANPPDYGKPDAFVLQNTNFIKQNQKLWAAKEQELQRQRELLRKSASRNKVNNSDGNKADNVEGKENEKIT